MWDAVGSLLYFLATLVFFFAIVIQVQTAVVNLGRIAAVLERAEQRANGRK